MEISMAWTPDRVEALKRMWSEGQSASQIANDLGGVTRNAVIGKVHRLGLSNRGAVSQKEKKGAVAAKGEHVKKAQKKRVQSEEKSTTSENVIHKKNHFGPEFNSEKKESVQPQSQNMSKPVIFTANQPLPPQPSNSEISEETLRNVKSIEKKSKKLSLMELTERTCKWPIGDPATERFWFCGHLAEPGKPYCETHIEIAFQPVASRRERRAR